MPAHQVTEACFTDHCHVHDEDENDSGAFRRCFECGHVYRTGQELVDAYNGGAAAMDRLHPHQASIPRITRPDETLFCPHCLHDF